jgi:predicted dehydrogenase
MLRLGIIGCGRVTSMFHKKAINQIDEISITALSDIIEARMNDLMDSWESPSVYIYYKDLLADPNVEAVAVNTPPKFHETIVLDAIAAGKHVLCEKPLAENIEGCLKIKDAIKKTVLTVLPAHNYVFTPSLNEMIRLVKIGSIGSITGVDVYFGNLLRSYRSKTDFRERKERGILEDLMPHILSIVHQLVGHIDKVDSVNWWCKDYDVCDNMNIELVSKNGVPIRTKMSWTKLRPRFSVRLLGEKGSMYTDLMINPYKLDIALNGQTKTWKKKGVNWYLDLVQFKHPSFKNQYEHFYQLVKESCTQLITVDDEIDMLETMVQISDKMG